MELYDQLNTAISLFLSNDVGDNERRSILSLIQNEIEKDPISLSKLFLTLILDNQKPISNRIISCYAIKMYNINISNEQIQMILSNLKELPNEVSKHMIEAMGYACTAEQIGMLICMQRNNNIYHLTLMMIVYYFCIKIQNSFKKNGLKYINDQNPVFEVILDFVFSFFSSSYINTLLSSNSNFELIFVAGGILSAFNPDEYTNLKELLISIFSIPFSLEIFPLFSILIDSFVSIEDSSKKMQVSINKIKEIDLFCPFPTIEVPQLLKELFDIEFSLQKLSYKLIDIVYYLEDFFSDIFNVDDFISSLFPLCLLSDAIIDQWENDIEAFFTDNFLDLSIEESDEDDNNNIRSIVYTYVSSHWTFSAFYNYAISEFPTSPKYQEVFYFFVILFIEQIRSTDNLNLRDFPFPLQQNNQILYAEYLRCCILLEIPEHDNIYHDVFSLNSFIIQISFASAVSLKYVQFPELIIPCIHSISNFIDSFSTSVMCNFFDILGELILHSELCLDKIINFLTLIKKKWLSNITNFQIATRISYLISNFSQHINILTYILYLMLPVLPEFMISQNTLYQAFLMYSGLIKSLPNFDIFNSITYNLGPIFKDCNSKIYEIFTSVLKLYIQENTSNNEDASILREIFENSEELLCAIASYFCRTNYINPEFANFITYMLLGNKIQSIGCHFVSFLFEYLLNYPSTDEHQKCNIKIIQTVASLILNTNDSLSISEMLSLSIALLYTQNPLYANSLLNQSQFPFQLFYDWIIKNIDFFFLGDQYIFCTMIGISLKHNSFSNNVTQAYIETFQNVFSKPIFQDDTVSFLDDNDPYIAHHPCYKMNSETFKVLCGF